MVDGNSRNEETDRIYIEWLNEMPDSKLESEARFTIWTCLTTLHGPYAYEVWQRDRVRQECERRSQPEVFARAEALMRNDPRISGEKETGVPGPPSEERNERSFYSSRIARTDPGFTSK